MWLVALYSLAFLVYVAFCAWEDAQMNVTVRDKVRSGLIAAGVVCALVVSLKAFF